MPRLAVLTVAVLLALVGCQPTATASPSAASSAAAPPGAPPSVPPEALQELERLVEEADVQAVSQAQPDDRGPAYLPGQGQTLETFSRTVGDDVNRFWRDTFEQAGIGDRYRDAELVLVAEGDTYRSNCGQQTATRGARYCYHIPGDRIATDQVLIGLTWADEDIYQKFGDKADFAVATIVAHEWGHHIQRSIGLLTDTEPYSCCGLYSIQLELNADCLAGMWAYSAYGRQQLEDGDIDEAIRAAQDAGDNQFTLLADPRAHGRPEQRVEWFKKGLDTGSAAACNAVLLPGNRVRPDSPDQVVPPTLPPGTASQPPIDDGPEAQVHNGIYLTESVSGDLRVGAGWVQLWRLVASELPTREEALASVRAEMAAATAVEAWRRWVVALADEGTFSVFEAAAVNEAVPELSGGHLWYWVFGCGFDQWYDGATGTVRVEPFDGCGGGTTGGGTPGGQGVPLVVEQQFCSIDQSRAVFRQQLDTLIQSAPGDWTSAPASHDAMQALAADLAGSVASWTSLVGEPVASYATTAAFASTAGAALAALDTQLAAIRGWSLVQAVPPPATEPIVAAATAMRAAVDAADQLIAAEPDLGCGTGLS
jgi:predicted metalloprotease